MARPTYQNDKNTADELAFMERVRRAGCQIWKVKQYYVYDFIMKKGGVTAFVEYKRRMVLKNTYPTIILSAHKFMNIKEQARFFCVKFFFYVEFNDGLFRADLTEYAPKGDSIIIGGRTDRGDSDDMEPVIEIPIDMFQK